MPSAKPRRMFADNDGRHPLLTQPLASLIAGVSLVAATGAQASATAEIRLRGTVPAECTISVSTDSVSLDIVQGGQDVQVATVTERCNAAGGYVVTVSSANAGRMVTGDGAASVGYTLSYDDATAAGSGGLSADRAVTGAARDRTLFATLPAAPQATAGTYTDTVTVSISAK